MTPKLVAALLLAIPVSWFAGVLADRIPTNLPLFRPLPGLRVEGKYLAILLLTGGLYVLAAWHFESASWPRFLAYLVFFGSLVPLTVIDLTDLRLPDRIVVPSLLTSIPVIVVASLTESDAAAIKRALLGGAFYFGFLFVFHLVYPRGMGFGDVKMAALLGLYVGWSATDFTQVLVLVLWAMIIGFVGGSIIGFVLFIVRGRSRQYPFGPFLIGGAVTVVLAGSALING